MRNIIPFNNEWTFTKEEPKARRLGSEVITLPHTWNAVDGQDGGNDYYRGTCWYIKNFNKPNVNSTDKVYIEFLGAAMIADVYINDKKIAHHEGGYSTFRVEITKELLEDENQLIVSLNNEDNNTVYPQKADFTFYGGLYRSVNLIVVPESHFELEYCGTTGIKVTPIVDLGQQSAIVTLEAWVKGPTSEVLFEIGEHNVMASVIDGYAKAELFLAKVRLWNGVIDPYLYRATASLKSGDQVTTKFGCRHFEISPQEGFILNGKSYPLRGVSRHQDYKDLGNALDMNCQKMDMKIIQEIGATTIRLAHYQHSQEFYDLCDEAGIIVWAEIPYITMHMKDGRANSISQMKELVIQNYNHPSIIVWGLSNEITAASAVDEDLLDNHRQLNDLCHKLDSTRPTTLANVFMLEIENSLLEIPDINSYNLYFGWYLGELHQNDEFFDEYHKKYPERCIGFSEYGADANPQYQTSNPEKGDYSETYQALYHEHMLKMIEARPWLWTTHVWNLFDFAADGRDEGGKHGENQKGLVTFDRKIKKDAFYLYKAAWNKEEYFVHLCGSRYKERIEKNTEIKVYSNLRKVALWVDGQFFEEKEGKTVFSFNVPIVGKHIIEVKGKDCVDQIEIRLVHEANETYSLKSTRSVLNWFDVEKEDPTCYSIADTLGEIRKNSEAGSILETMMAKNVESRGDVAEVVKDNPALIRMMNPMTLLSLLKQADADEESIKQINRVLQRIKKTEDKEE